MQEIFENYQKVLSNYNFRNVWIAQMGTGLGGSLYFIALSWIIWDITNSTAQSGIFAIMYDIPQLLLGLWIGVIISRYNLKRLLVISDSIRAGLVLTVMTLYLFDLLTVNIIFLCIFLEGILVVFNRPATNAIIPQIVNENELETANATTQMSNRIVNTAGYGIGGLLIAGVGAFFNILVNAFSLLFSAFLISRLKNIKNPFEGKDKSNIKDDFKEGFRYLKKTPALITIFSIGILMNVGGAPITVLGPAYVENILGAGSGGYGLIQGSWFVGIALGALYIGSKKINSLWKILALGFFTQGIAQVFFGLSSSIYLSMFFIIIHGVAMSIANIPLFSFVQRTVPSKQLPHVFSILGTLVSMVNPLAFGASGVLAEFIGIRQTYMIGGMLPLIATLLIVLPSWLKNANQE
ncbi:MFS transporter [Lysinibacillus sp. NPDC086135]|uniref:MFS transporter n=1 Tax=Lysinibacillus sp. NPDC086135 TaxID=3364130 RepID=UPI003815FECD